MQRGSRFLSTERGRNCRSFACDFLVTGTSDLSWRFSSSSRTEVSMPAEFKLREGTASGIWLLQ
jgi:hypothetical protein